MGRILTIPRKLEDDFHLVEIHNQFEREGCELSVHTFRAEMGENLQAWTAFCGGRVVGYSRLRLAWWRNDPCAYEMDIRVEPDFQRRGVATELYSTLFNSLQERAISRIECWVRGRNSGGMQFVLRHGFRESGEVIQEYRLDLADANPIECKSLGEGVRIVRLSEIAGDRESFLHSLKRLWDGINQDEAKLGTPESSNESFLQWKRQVIEGNGLSAETHWVALDGNAPVGCTYLRRLNGESAENDFTGVAKTHRERGIATAMKLRSIDWAKQNGVKRFYTSSEVGNSSMIGIHLRLGYFPGEMVAKAVRES